MSRRPIDDMAQKIASGCADVWSLGPFSRPSEALKRSAPWLWRMEDKYGEDGSLAAVDNVRLIQIGHTWWVEIQFDNASVMSPATEKELDLL